MCGALIFEIKILIMIIVYMYRAIVTNIILGENK